MFALTFITCPLYIGGIFEMCVGVSNGKVGGWVSGTAVWLLGRWADGFQQLAKVMMQEAWPLADLQYKEVR